MSNTYNLSLNLHSMTSDVSYFLSHVTLEGWLAALILTAAGVYALNRSKSAFIIALSGALYLLPFLITGAK